MSDSLRLYGFGVNDRSGKVRWLAHELGIEVQEERLGLGAHREAPYSDLNPYAMVPTVIWRDQTLIESTATCTFLAEEHPDSQLIVPPGHPQRAQYLQWVALFSETLESRLVEHLLAKFGVFPPAYLETTTPGLERRLPVMLGQLPSLGFLVADRFTLADIEAAYSLRLAIKAGLIELEAVAGYLTPLMERPAAKAAQFFQSIEPKDA